MLCFADLDRYDMLTVVLQTLDTQERWYVVQKHPASDPDMRSYVDDDREQYAAYLIVAGYDNDDSSEDDMVVELCKWTTYKNAVKAMLQSVADDHVQEG